MSDIDARPDAKLHQDAVRGGPEAFTPIVRRYQDAVFGVALARLRDFHAAEDVAQQVFVEAFQRLGGLRDPSRLGAWLRTIAIHKCIDRLRRPRGKSMDDDSHADDKPRPDEAMERRELREQVLAAIGRLGQAQRETTTLFYVNGYSVAEVAEMQEVPLGTVKRRLHDAREKLKEELIHMVEDVLKSEAPADDFAERVFELLSLYPDGRIGERWRRTIDELRKIGAEGFDGFARALESPHSPTRVFAVHMVQKHAVPGAAVAVAEILKKALSDPNKRVRAFAVCALTSEAFDHDRVAREFVPLLLPLLQDASKRVRRRVTYELINWADCVPMVAVVKALLAEQDREAIKRQKMLLHAIVCGEHEDSME